MTGKLRDEKLYKYVDSFAIIEGGRVIIASSDKKVSIRIKDIRKILLLKRRMLHFNFLLYFILLGFIILLFTGNMVLVSKLFIICIILFIGIMGIFFKTFQYKIILIKKYDFIELIIEKESLIDAENLLLTLNKHIAVNEIGA